MQTDLRCGQNASRDISLCVRAFVFLTQREERVCVYNQLICHSIDQHQRLCV